MFIAASFILIVLGILDPSLGTYVTGLAILGFIIGSIFAYLNAIRQGKEMVRVENETTGKRAKSTESSEIEEGRKGTAMKYEDSEEKEVERSGHQEKEQEIEVTN